MVSNVLFDRVDTNEGRELKAKEKRAVRNTPSIMRARAHFMV
jgi:hypothetical protein